MGTSAKIQKSQIAVAKGGERISDQSGEQATSSSVASGYRMRHAHMSDLEQVVALIRTCEADEIGTSNIGLSEIEGDWTSPRFELAHNTRIVEAPSGDIVAYVEIWDTSDVPVNVWCWGCVHPSHIGLGIGSRMLQWAERQSRLAIPRCPEEARITMQAGCYHEHQPGHDLLKGHGMTLIRHFWEMEIALDGSVIPTPVWPKGITLRTFRDYGDLRKVAMAVEDAFKDHYGYVEQPLESLLTRWQHWLETDEKIDLDMWYLAMDGDEIAGACLCRQGSWTAADSGYVNTLGVRRAWRRQGLALAMLHHTFREFSARSFSRVELGVDASSLTGATRLYRKAGMHIKYQRDTYEKEVRPGQDLMKRTL